LRIITDNAKKSTWLSYFLNLRIDSPMLAP
jgi:hypothetical protein